MSAIQEQCKRCKGIVQLQRNGLLAFCEVSLSVAKLIGLQFLGLALSLGLAFGKAHIVAPAKLAILILIFFSGLFLS